MATYYIFQWNRYIIYECPWCPRLIQVHNISTFNPPAFPHFSLLRFPKVDFMSGKEAKFGDNVSKMLLMGIKDHYNTIIMRAWL